MIIYLLGRSDSGDKMSVRLFPELLRCSLRLDSFIHKKHRRQWRQAKRMRAELTPPPRRTPGGCKQGIPASQNFSMTSPPSLFPAITSSLEKDKTLGEAFWSFPSLTLFSTRSPLMVKLNIKQNSTIKTSTEAYTHTPIHPTNTHTVYSVSAIVI